MEDTIRKKGTDLFFTFSRRGIESHIKGRKVAFNHSVAHKVEITHRSSTCFLCLLLRIKKGDPLAAFFAVFVKPNPIPPILCPGS